MFLDKIISLSFLFEVMENGVSFKSLPQTIDVKTSYYTPLNTKDNKERVFGDTEFQNIFKKRRKHLFFHLFLPSILLFCLRSIRMLCPSLIKVWSYINTCAAVIAGTWDAHSYDCKIESINTFQNQFEIKKILPKFFPNVTAK